MDKKCQDNRASQKNSNNPEYWKVRGYQDRPKDWKDQSSKSFSSMSKDAQDYRSRQMNPNNQAYYKK
ncbi:unnamed protein product [Acanthoscelides obtectus]|uniref:Uncharacterized protein n=1 Tax=Acanthoscelides obtectus TaxID=200917 RepID=A0A9P0LPV3_ACAOB|nr:unnamed protein product [Acanthoscelides obtectus]CAK1677875.1 hypothetical protein AOBTE_LOCUS31606 [Acanthoscelides obtectus]